jgi:CubicO group peptidase (beta-lactamase class C family)
VDVAKIQTAVEEGVRQRAYPGAAWSVWAPSGTLTGVVGAETYLPDALLVTVDTLWDLASLTKVVGTTAMAMLLWQRGQLDLEAPVVDFLPHFGAKGKGTIRVRHLLSHISGLAASGLFVGRRLSAEQIYAEIDGADLAYPTGKSTVYSDLGFITLGRVLETIAGRKLDEFMREEIFVPLGMSRTCFNPTPTERRTAAPTEPVEPWRVVVRGEVWEFERLSDGIRYTRGEVHDPTAAMLGGVAGHAGLFSTIGDLTLFAGALLSGDSIFSSEAVRLFSTRTGDSESRAFGWDTNWRHDASAGPNWPEATFGHTGFTGTSIWLDLDRQAFAILLTNRVHPTAENLGIKEARLRFHRSVAGQ